MRASVTLLLMIIAVILHAQIQPAKLTCEYKVNPVAIDILQPRFSWQYQQGLQDMMQGAYRIQVATASRDLVRGRRLVWDSQKVHSEQSAQVEYDGTALQSRQRYYWRVKGWDQHGMESEWSEPGYWEMGILDSTEWSARWIGPPWPEQADRPNPPPIFRKSIDLQKHITRARLYITSHGLYEAYINGERVGDDLFTPGWTSFKKRLQYQTYDVTDKLSPGQNCLGVIVGDGWYRGRFGFDGSRNIYGEKTALFCQLEVEYRNGKKEIIVSDESWKSTTGPIQMSSLYDGEIYDARQEIPGWARAAFDDSAWDTVTIMNYSIGRIIAPQGVPVHSILELEPKAVITTPKGETVVDMGQNMVGWVRLTVEGEEGDTITLQHAEVLDKEGNFYVENLRDAAQTIQYICRGGTKEVYEPHFTFQGFRYVKVEGFPGKLTHDVLRGVVVHSDMDLTGSFISSDPKLNQLHHNIQWGQRGNFLDVPTDCPQRDERMGWTGDAQAFASTACFNFNTAAFYTKWLHDLAADQNENGSVPFVVPNVLGEGASGSTGWGDAATIIPWTMYLKYGDKRILEEQYLSMKAWVNYLDNLAGENHLVQDGFHFGDWLFFIHPSDWNAKPGHTDIDFIATSFFAHSTEILVKTANLLGEKDDMRHFSQLLSEVKEAFRNEFVTSNGRLSPHSQTAYTLALTFGLLSSDQEAKAARYLRQDIENRQHHLSTGFLGSSHLPYALSNHGMADVAYKLLFQESYPSWLYPVTRGATTIWERWDGIKPDGTFQTARMNSFNHYAYGAIGDWMYSVMAGLQEDESNPGYKHIIFKPHPHEALDSVWASHTSLYGPIQSGWKFINDSIVYQVAVPPNTTATVILPRDGISQTENAVARDLLSGRHRFANHYQRGKGKSTFSVETTFGVLWNNEKTKAVILRHIPILAQAPVSQLEQGFSFPLSVVAQYAPDIFTKEVLDKISMDLMKIN